MIKPKRLSPGDTIGVISPASPSENRSEVFRAKEYIEAMGYNVVIGKNVNKTRGITAASEEDRLDDIHEMFRRDDVDAVFVTQGGYGCAQLLRNLDFDLIKEHPKIPFPAKALLLLCIFTYIQIPTFNIYRYTSAVIRAKNIASCCIKTFQCGHCRMAVTVMLSA